MPNEAFHRIAYTPGELTVSQHRSMVSKIQEREYAECASRLLQAGWNLVEIPEPLDFIVRVNEESFGLEVTEIFVDSGTKRRSKSNSKEGESFRREKVASITKIYYNLGGAPITAQFLGELATNNEEDIALAMLNCAPSYPGIQIVAQLACLKVFMTPLPPVNEHYSSWAYVDDRVGWVREVTLQHIQAAVDKKAYNLDAYKEKITEVDLLIVANRIFNSGRMASRTQCIQIEKRGFRRIYFLSFPESIECVG